MVERDRRLSMRIADQEWQMLQALAERDGISASDYVRLFIRQQHAAAFGSRDEKSKKGKR